MGKSKVSAMPQGAPPWATGALMGVMGKGMTVRGTAVAVGVGVGDGVVVGVAVAVGVGDGVLEGTGEGESGRTGDGGEAGIVASG
jgi:hypothetical protein